MVGHFHAAFFVIISQLFANYANQVPESIGLSKGKPLYSSMSVVDIGTGQTLPTCYLAILMTGEIMAQNEQTCGTRTPINTVGLRGRSAHPSDSATSTKLGREVEQVSGADLDVVQVRIVVVQVHVAKQHI